MAYSPTELNNPPSADPEYDAAAEPTPENPNVFTPAVQDAEVGPDGLPLVRERPKAGPGATSYDYGGGKASV